MEIKRIDEETGEESVYTKVNGAWKEVTVYKKVNGSWQQISDPATVIDTIQKYYLKS